MYDRPLCCRNKFHQQWRTSPHLLSSTGLIFKSVSAVSNHLLPQRAGFKLSLVSRILHSLVWALHTFCSTLWTGDQTPMTRLLSLFTCPGGSLPRREGKRGKGELWEVQATVLPGAIYQWNPDSTFILCFKGWGHWLPYSQNIQQSRWFLGEQFLKDLWFRNKGKGAEKEWSTTINNFPSSVRFYMFFF